MDASGKNTLRERQSLLAMFSEVFPSLFVYITIILSPYLDFVPELIETQLL